MKKIKYLTLVASFIFISNILFAQNKMDARKIINNWPETAKKAANAMLDKYGEPAESTPTMLIWEDTKPFVRTIVYKEEIDHDFPMPHKDVLEQFIHYDVAVDMYDELARFDGSVIVERTKGEMSARCDKEAANMLALNLANDILQGKSTVEEARQKYGDTMMKMLMGEKPMYLQKLVFDVPQNNITNSDQTTMDMAKVKKLKKEGK
jgi:hypothetical protein